MHAGTWWNPRAARTLLRRPSATQLHALRRAAAVAILAALGLFVIGCMAFGFVNGGVRARLGTALGPSHHLVDLDSRLISGGSYRLVAVTPAGTAAGFAPGQTIDMTTWSLDRKLAYAYPTAGRSKLAAHQGLQTEIRAEAFNPHSRDSFYLHALNILVRLILLASALFIVQFSHGRAALAAGLYLAAAAMADSLTATFAGLPGGVQAAALVLANLARPTAYACRVAFSMELCPGTRQTKRVIWAVFATLLATLFTLDLGGLSTILFDTPPLPVSPLLLPLVQCVTQLYSLGIFIAAAVAAPAPQRFVLRIVLAATFITLASYIVQEAYLLAGAAPPAWLSWYFETALLGAGIGYPWAIFARRIAGVDFIIGRGIAYALSIGLILIAVELVKLAAQAVAGDWVNGLVLIYAIPVVLTVSLNWLQGQMTRLIGLLLDGDLRSAAKQLHALAADFPQAADVAALARMVASRAAPALHMASATITLEPPPPDPSGGLLLPLHIFGRALGTLRCGARPHGRGYDHAERKLLEALAHEISVAIVCLEPARLAAAPALAQIA